MRDLRDQVEGPNQGRSDRIGMDMLALSDEIHFVTRISSRVFRISSKSPAVTEDLFHDASRILLNFQLGIRRRGGSLGVGKGEIESAAHTQLALGPNLPTMKFHEALRDKQPQLGALR